MESRSAQIKSPGFPDGNGFGGWYRSPAGAAGIDAVVGSVVGVEAVVALLAELHETQRRETRPVIATEIRRFTMLAALVAG